MPTDTVTDLRWTLPLRADEYGCYVFDADGHMIVQIRGWGHLTGQGGLRLPEDEAIAVQVAWGKAIAAAVNALATPGPAKDPTAATWHAGQMALYRRLEMLAAEDGRDAGLIADMRFKADMHQRAARALSGVGADHG